MAIKALEKSLALLLVVFVIASSLAACKKGNGSSQGDFGSDAPKEVKIHKDFVGGNIRILSQDGDTYHIQNEQRDTTQDWFYWAFCVEGAEGKTLTFKFDKVGSMSEYRIGHYGPAVSTDLENWEWLGKDSMKGNRTFTYTFKEGENKVYFAHSMLYHPKRFEEFAKENGLEIKELCKSREGRSVPYVTIGNGAKKMLLTSRHHACESSGSYVLEGVLGELLKTGVPEGIQVICVPFVDYDGVLNGDQGKYRNGRDHNNDYYPLQEATYPEIAKIKEIGKNEDVLYAFDFHSPWHTSEENDYVYGFYNLGANENKHIKFCEILKNSITEDSMKFSLEHTSATRQDSVEKIKSFRKYFDYSGAELAFCLETTYFGLSDNVFSQNKAVELGRCFAKSIFEYHNSK